MIVFKPYGHLTEIDTEEYSLTLVMQLYDGYDIYHPEIHHISSDSRVQVNLPLISVPGQIHTAPKELHIHLDNVPKGFKIQALTSTKIPSTSLPTQIRELAFDITKSPLVFGLSVFCTEGAEKGKEDREGVGKKKPGDPIDP